MTLSASPTAPAAASARDLRPGDLGPAGATVTDEAIRTLGAAIHAELRESLRPEDVVRLATDLLGRVNDELRAARHAKT